MQHYLPALYRAIDGIELVNNKSIIYCKMKKSKSILMSYFHLYFEF